MSAGTYVEHLDFKGKDVTVASEDRPHLTFIDGNGTASVVRFNSDERQDAVPGGGMMLKITDLPGTGPAGDFYSSQGRYDPPLPSPCGDGYLVPPQSFVYPMGTVPSPGGVLEIALRIPGGLPPLFEVHLQAIPGNPPVLTNPSTLFIK